MTEATREKKRKTERRKTRMTISSNLMVNLVNV